jgi:predicted peroxiredoxin
MPGKYVVSLTHGLDNPDKATVAFVVANAAVASDKDTVVFLSIEGTRLSQKGVAEWRALLKLAEKCTSAPPALKNVNLMKTIWSQALRLLAEPS